MKQVLALTAVLACVCAGMRPAYADGAASTRNIILGGAAAAAAVMINGNVQRKHLAHDSVAGYTRDGGTVYADGRIEYPNGDVVYPNDANAEYQDTGRYRGCRHRYRHDDDDRGYDRGYAGDERRYREEP